MKLKVLNFFSLLGLLLAPITGVFSVLDKPNVTKAESSWDYDTANPALGTYDKLLQAAGPRDGVVDWYPAKDALGNHPRGQELVKQLLQLSQETNSGGSNVGTVLFSDTCGDNRRPDYEATYQRYQLAFGFIAQILNLDNAVTGSGAKLAQGAQKGNDPLDPQTDASVITAEIQKVPARGWGRNISDILGDSFTANQDGYVQIYFNGYDNTIQNEANIIREATSSITVMAQSKLTGRKATAIFKLNNCTLPFDAPNAKLNNYVDNSAYAQDQNSLDVAGLNMTTATQSLIDRLQFSKNSTFWVKNKNGGGTIVVPRNTSAQEIAQLIAQKEFDTNNTLAGSAPMKAIQGASGSAALDANQPIGNKTLKEVSYNHFYQREKSLPDGNNIGIGSPTANPFSSSGNTEVTPDKRSIYNYAPPIAYGGNGPFAFNDNQYREYNNVFNGKSGSLGQSDLVYDYNGFKRSNVNYLTAPNQTTDGWFGGNGHAIDTNQLYQGNWHAKSALQIPDVSKSEGDPYQDDDSTNYQGAIYPQTKTKLAGVAGKSDPRGQFTNVGKVKHLFSPSSYFKEAYDANHFVMNSPQLQNPQVAAIAREIANNGSFSDTSAQGQIKKSFTYDAPVSAFVYKSYNNPYSTVMSSAGAQTRDGAVLAKDWSNSTIQPQAKLNLNDLNEEMPQAGHGDVIEIGQGQTTALKADNKPNEVAGTYFYCGTFANKKLEIKIPQTNQKVVLEALGDSSNNQGTLNKFGLIGTDGISRSPAILGFTNMDGSNQVRQKYDTNAQNLTGPQTLYPRATAGIPFTNPRFKNVVLIDDSQSFVQTWDKNTTVQDNQGNHTATPHPLIYNQKVKNFDISTLGSVDSPNFEAKYYLAGALVVVEDKPNNYRVSEASFTDHLIQAAASKRAYFNSNLYNNPQSAFAQGSKQNNSRFFVSQDFSIGPVSADMITDPAPIPAAGLEQESDITIDGVTYPSYKAEPGASEAKNAAKILHLAVMYNNPSTNLHNHDAAQGAPVNEFTDTGSDSNHQGSDGTGYKLVGIADAAQKQGIATDLLAAEVAKVTKKSLREVKSTKWVQATLPRLKKNAGTARINVVVYDPTTPAKPLKPQTKPSFAVTQMVKNSTGVITPKTKLYDDGAVLTPAQVPASFQNLIEQALVVNNPDLSNAPNRLAQFLVGAFLDSWQQNRDFQVDNYLAGGFGISDSDVANSYCQWPQGYLNNEGAYLQAVSDYPNDFYRGGAALQLASGQKIAGLAASVLSADVSKIDLSKAGTYPVVFTYTNPQDATDSAKITVPITVQEALAPVFTFQGGSDLTIHEGQSFDPHNFKVVGDWTIFNEANGDYEKVVNGKGIARNPDGSLAVTVRGSVDVNTPGIYQLVYEATNLAGNKTQLVRNIHVLANPNDQPQSNWTYSDFKSIGYVNYVPGYGINVWQEPAANYTGEKLIHGSAWRISQKAINRQGQVYYRVGKNQWVDGQYLSFVPPVTVMKPLKGVVTINYVPGYGVNLWKTAGTTGGYYPRKLPHGSKWQVFGSQNGFYNVGKNQWLQAQYAKFN